MLRGGGLLRGQLLRGRIVGIERKHLALVGTLAERAEDPMERRRTHGNYRTITLRKSANGRQRMERDTWNRGDRGKGTKGTGVLTNSGENTIILDPWEGKLVTTTPFDVIIHTGTSSEATTVDLYLDGKLLETKTEPPFVFTVKDMLANSQHTLKATATHFGFFESSTSVKFKTFFNPPPLEPRGKK
jgi:hypothetical protein